MDEFRLYTDGATSRVKNLSGIGAVLMNGLHVVDTVSEPVPWCPTNETEYLGLVAGLSMARRNAVQECEVWMDSQLVVRQMEGVYAIRDPKLEVLNTQAKALMDQFEKVTLIWVPRRWNHRADKLAKDGLDSGVVKP